MARILPPTDASVHQAARFLVSGEVVALPTETVYGLAADATNPSAVAKIFAVKERPATNPLIVHVAAKDWVYDYAEPVDDNWERLADAFWPGPLTLILPRREKRVVDAVTAGRDTVGLRVPDVALTRSVIREAGLPLAAPSANPAGYVSPTSAQHVERSLGERIPLILDGGPCHHGIESTILDLSQGGHATLLRPGPLSLDSLESVLDVSIETLTLFSQAIEAQMAPGQFSAHYQPRAKVTLWEQIPPDNSCLEHPAVVFFQRNTRSFGGDCRYLSEGGDCAEAARNLYKVLRELDEAGFKHILVERAPDTALGQSINDRLQRASA